MTEQLTLEEIINCQIAVGLWMTHCNDEDKSFWKELYWKLNRIGKDMTSRDEQEDRKLFVGCAMCGNPLDECVCIEVDNTKKNRFADTLWDIFDVVMRCLWFMSGLGMVIWIMWIIISVLTR